MRYIETERQLADILTKPIDSTCVASLRGGGGAWCLLTLWHGLRGLLFYLVYIHRNAFHYYLPSLPIASLIMLACIWLTMLVIVLG
jgi:hypothetical protein